MGLVNRFRKPEYTGQNRCMACTVVNLVLGTLFAAGGGFLAARVHSTATGAAVAAAIGVAAVLSIWLRGYLVPKTPTLTKRYMPAWLLAWFGKAPESRIGEDPIVEDEAESVDAEGILLDHGVMESCRGGEEYCLTDAFVDDWERTRRERDPTLDAETLATALGVDPDADEEMAVERVDRAVKFVYGGSKIAMWPSPAAARADVVSAAVLSEWFPDWRQRVLYERAMLYKSIRILLDRCPNGEDTELREEVVESCCSTHDVFTVVCSEGGQRLVEQPAN